MSKTLVSLMNYIVEWHVAKQHIVGRTLLPGLPKDDIEAVLAEESLHPLPELTALYHWRNGSADEDQLEYPFMLYHRFLPLEQALEARDQLLEEYRFEACRFWLPVLTFEGEYFCVDCSSDSKAGRVRFLLCESPEFRDYAFSSLTHLAQVSLEGYRSCCRKSSDGGFALDLDIPALATVHARIDPGGTFPWAV